MAYILQGTGQKLNGKRYEAGNVVPDDAVTPHMVRLGMVVTVPDSAVAVLREGGGDYDPSQHTVQEVLEYLDGHPDQTAEVRQAEQDGGARKTLLAELDERLQAEEEPQAGSPETEGDAGSRHAPNLEPQALSVPLTEPTPARDARAGELTGPELEEMRAEAGTDPGAQPDPSAPLPADSRAAKRRRT